ncbi:transcriptional regulator [Halorubrum ezzemoulense]|uniref:Transcriptional regulator n=1 Tax=Halorubrum ezzemoulense TaxID=337243 RepID=A0A238YFL1_HALEZ|nr:TrmB family transcriptional regulator [Halorubrum ezzemoulense]SNR69927.1 transcriptional regulator [Halorubrum ezzemoulense]
MGEREIQAALQDLGLSQYQADAYTATLELGSAPAVDIADTAGVPRARIYDVLRKLEAEGYVETYEQDSLHARALNPIEATGELEQRAETFTRAAEQIDSLWEDPGVEDSQITIVKRQDTVYEQADRFISEATNEIQLTATPTEFTRLRDALAGARDRGVYTQLTFLPPTESASLDATTIDFEGAVTEARVRTLPGPFVLISDREKTCFAPQTPWLNNSYGLIADNFPIAHVFHRYFQTTHWDAWESVYSAQAEDPPITYVNLRHCITDLEPIVSDGATVRVTVEGIDTASREQVTVSGTVTDLLYSEATDVLGTPELADIARQVAIVVSDDRAEYTVGGWYARVEDIEMRRLTIDEIE